MPIQKDQFENGIDARSTATALLDFLSRNEKVAYTAGEIASELGISEDTIWYVANRLVREELIEKRIVEGKAYFTISEDYSPGDEEEFV